MPARAFVHSRVRARASTHTQRLRCRFNCFVFLDFASYKPACELLDLGNDQVGLINSMGWFGILSTLPLVTVCTWHRSLLFAAAIVNAAAPALRYYSAVQQSYELMVVSSFAVGSVYGVIGAWPPILARLLFRPQYHTLVTAVASLANYVGGAVGTTLLPALVKDAADLKVVLEIQMWVGGGLAVVTLSWLALPPVLDDIDSAPGIIEQLKICARVAPHMLCFGLFIGISLLLQGMNSFIISHAGFGDFDGGVANTVYQSVAAIVGVVLGALFGNQLSRTIRWMHGIATVSFCGLAGLCYVRHRHGDFGGATPAMLALMAALGGSLMGALPFMLQRAIATATPATENVVCGLLFTVSISVAAGLTEVTSTLKALDSLKLIGGLLAIELAIFVFVDRREGKETTPLLPPEGSATSSPDISARQPHSADHSTHSATRRLTF